MFSFEVIDYAQLFQPKEFFRTSADISTSESGSFSAFASPSYSPAKALGENVELSDGGRWFDREEGS